ncbi:hypothetical protein C9374_013886 [Naegleria lovaniensis]|uniref:Uncharacterized protein n=1 Tax=Naegleria lovaniensis TaxID=51637 RepID=A0AA88GVR3_NAELO|nr:uncharacterized protein C9374_013886 [Naegleria lovaniensis]KAG2389326.1 hypothetical protein C9374_013886 [Naegleria lovaniensis]
MSNSTSSSAPSLWTRFINYISSWLSFLVEFICSLYRDELQRQSRESEDYHRWKQHKQEEQEPFMTTSTTPILSSSTIQEDEENVLGHVSKKSSSQPSTPILPNTALTRNNEPQVEAIQAQQQEQHEDDMFTEQTPLLVTPKKVLQDEQQTPSKPQTPQQVTPQKEETNSSPQQQISVQNNNNKTAPNKPQQKTPINNKSQIPTPVKVSKSNSSSSDHVTSPSEASGLIGERLKLKKAMKNKLLSQNAYQSLLKNNKSNKQSGEESGSQPLDHTTSSSDMDSSEIIAQKNSQILQRKLSSKPSFARRRPTNMQQTQQEKKPSIDILSKLENEASIELPSVEKFADLEEQAQLEKKLGTENAMKQQQEMKKRNDDEAVIESSNNSPSKSPSSATKGNNKGPQVSLAAILGAKNSLRKTQ